MNELDEIITKVPQRIVTQVALNTADIRNVKDDIHEIRESLKEFRHEAREDAKATRQAILGFATAICVPIIIAAIKIAFT